MYTRTAGNPTEIKLNNGNVLLCPCPSSNGRNFQLDKDTRSHEALALEVETLRMAMQVAALKWAQRASILAKEEGR